MEFFNTPVPALHGTVIAGEAAATRQKLDEVINFTNRSMFDIADLLLVIKKNNYYDGFTTFADFTKSLKFKTRRLQYLVKMAEVMDAVGIPREKYEPLGLSKLREITSLDVNGTWINPETKEETPVKDFIRDFVDKGQNLGLEEIKQYVKILKGLAGEDTMGWVNLYMKQMAIDQVVRPALSKAKMLIGSVSKDDEGISKDASDGQAAEVVFVAYLTDEKEGQNV